MTRIFWLSKGNGAHAFGNPTIAATSAVNCSPQSSRTLSTKSLTISNNGRLLNNIERSAVSPVPSLCIGGVGRDMDCTLLKGFSSPFYNQVRTNIRNYFPRPRENKRVLVHGWNKRMSTPSGRRIIMKRILKGRHSLAHDYLGKPLRL